MLNTIRENAKWFVAVPIVCFGALIFVDWGMSPGNSMTQRNVVGKVEGEKIPFESFNKEVESEAKLATQQGRELDAAQYAAIRSQVFEKFVRIQLIQKDYKALGLYGSPLEVLEFLKQNPPPGAEKAPVFMGPDSQFSRTKYLQWLSNPRVFDDPYMRSMEEQVAALTVPEQQINYLLPAMQPVSDLELKFRSQIDRSRVWGTIVVAPSDSFVVDPSSITAAQMRTWFDAHPDTLWHSKSVAILPYVAFPKTPSRADSLQAKNQIDSVARMAKAGESFADLARNYSEDPGSAKNGGDLGGFQSLKQWVPEFGAAARLLDSGKISDPIRSQFGWHVIKSNGRKIANNDTLYSLAHVLVTIQTSPETVDSLKARAEEFRKQVKAGKSFAEVAKSFGVKVDSSAPLTDGEKNGLSGGAYLAGLNAFSFRAEDAISEVLENAQAVQVAGRGRLFPAGRDFDLVRNTVLKQLWHELGTKQAVAWLESNSAKIAACDTVSACLSAIGKLRVVGLPGRPVGIFVDGFGFASPAALKLWKTTAARSWSKVASNSMAAMTLKIDSTLALDNAGLTKAIAESRPAAHQNRFRYVLDNWYRWRRESATVENHLDRYFRD
jgi:peptidyl-prolyl cis-trans isomerase D